MDKFAEISRTAGTSKAKDIMFKTLDPKNNQNTGFAEATMKAAVPQNIMIKPSEGGTKLPPIQKKPTLKSDKNASGGSAAQKMTRNSSAAKSTAFGAKSIDLLKSL